MYIYIHIYMYIYIYCSLDIFVSSFCEEAENMDPTSYRPAGSNAGTT